MEYKQFERDQLKKKLDVVEVISRYVELRKSDDGSKFTGICPICKKEKLDVYPWRQSWHCYECNIGGDVFAFLGAIGSDSLEDSIRMLLGEEFLKGNVVPGKHQKRRVFPVNGGWAWAQGNKEIVSRYYISHCVGKRDSKRSAARKYNTTTYWVNACLYLAGEYTRVANYLIREFQARGIVAGEDPTTTEDKKSIDVMPETPYMDAVREILAGPKNKELEDYKRKYEYMTRERDRVLRDLQAAHEKITQQEHIVEQLVKQLSDRREES